MYRTVNGVRRHLGGWNHDRPDNRDQAYRNDAIAVLPSSADNSRWIGRIDDQGSIGSCTANASTGAMEFLYRKIGLSDPGFSRLFVYYCSRVLVEGIDPANDSGCQIRDVMKAIAKYGACFETVWPYDVDQFSTKPSDVAFKSALAHQLIRYNSCPDLDSVRTCMALGFPVVFGFSVPESFMSDQTAKDGIALYPATNESFVGGHAVMAIGYDDTKLMPWESNPGAIYCVNSWGEDWGQGGKFWLPNRYFTTGLADDAWCVRREGMAIQ